MCFEVKQREPILQVSDEEEVGLGRMLARVLTLVGSQHLQSLRETRSGAVISWARAGHGRVGRVGLIELGGLVRAAPREVDHLELGDCGLPPSPVVANVLQADLLCSWDIARCPVLLTTSTTAKEGLFRDKFAVQDKLILDVTALERGEEEEEGNLSERFRHAPLFNGISHLP